MERAVGLWEGLLREHQGWLDVVWVTRWGVMVLEGFCYLSDSARQRVGMESRFPEGKHIFSSPSLGGHSP